MKIEASVLLGDRDEEVEVHGESDCWDFGRGRCSVAGGRDTNAVSRNAQQSHDLNQRASAKSGAIHSGMRARGVE